MSNSNHLIKYNFLASLDVDAQQCFTPLCPDELPVPDGDKIVHELNSQAKYAKCRLGSKDAHHPDALWTTKDAKQITKPIASNILNNYQNLDVYWPAHAMPGTQGFELIPGLPKPSDYDFFVWKGIELDMHPYGACYHDLAQKMSTGLIEYLVCQKISHVVVGGLALEYCVFITVNQLVSSGFKVILNLAATKGLDEIAVIKAKAELHEKGVIFIENSSQLANILG